MERARRIASQQNSPFRARFEDTLLFSTFVEATGTELQTLFFCEISL
jgi:hypothetical protein